MKVSTHCVYCGVLMNRIVNDPHSRTVEHMIPQVSVSIKRTNGEGDFHVCKKCNSEKSRIDEVLGVICRMVGEHKDGSFDAIKRFHKALARNDSKFIRAFESVESGIKGTVNYIKEQYKRQHASEAFDDLSKNSRIQNINKESFLIAGSNSRVMFICLNRVIMFHIQFLDRTFVNQKKCKKALRSLKKRIKT